MRDQARRHAKLKLSSDWDYPSRITKKDYLGINQEGIIFWHLTCTFGVPSNKNPYRDKWPSLCTYIRQLIKHERFDSMSLQGCSLTTTPPTTSNLCPPPTSSGCTVLLISLLKQKQNITEADSSFYGCPWRVMAVSNLYPGQRVATGISPLSIHRCIPPLVALVTVAGPPAIRCLPEQRSPRNAEGTLEMWKTTASHHACRWIAQRWARIMPASINKMRPKILPAWTRRCLKQNRTDWMWSLSCEALT